jgi:hypothetical protein
MGGAFPRAFTIAAADAAAGIFGALAHGKSRWGGEAGEQNESQGAHGVESDLITWIFFGKACAWLEDLSVLYR